MKLILSRKGFDSSNGRCESPIFPDGTMFSLPIPVAEDKITYGKLRHVSEDLGVINIGDVVKDLTHGRYGPNSRAHLDPDINRHAYRRREGWRGLFGQVKQAQGHLANEGVEKGDLFLFFGRFREVERTNGEWSFIPEATKKHVIFGWLQIGDIRQGVGSEGPSIVGLPWASHHPHLQYGGGDKNTLYVATEDLKIGNRFKASGHGVFPHFDKRLQLTNPHGAGISQWRLPSWFYPSADKKMLSWHGNNYERWTLEPDAAYLNSQDQGQEFVLDCDHYPEAIGWASDFIRDFGER